MLNLSEMNEVDRAWIENGIRGDGEVWRPMIDEANEKRYTPQRTAYDSMADILLYGGSAGGGKTDLGIGLALTQHSRSIIFRREHKQLSGIVERIFEMRGDQGWNGQEQRFNLPDGRLIRLGGMKNLGDEKAYQGRSFDLQVWDELTEFLERQFRFISTWNRTTNPKQRCRIVAATNPPTTAEGEWVIEFWGPWLDPQHPYPALPGHLRWFIADKEGVDQEVEDGSPVTVDGEEIVPRSRTFIPSSVEDNPFLMATAYKATLQSLPEPLRSQMLRGDFLAGRQDDVWQVLPSEWVEAAQSRWVEKRPRQSMTSLGVDVARGGQDQTVIAPRYGSWFGELLTFPGKETPDGPTVSGQVIASLRDGAPVNIDVIGVGSSPYDHLKSAGVTVNGLNSSERSEQTDRTSRLRFSNKRAQWWWQFREALDPQNSMDVQLPLDRKLKADLCTPRWTMLSNGIRVESKEDIIKRLGRSPDRGDAVVYAWAESRRAKTKDIEYPPMGIV